MAGSFKDRLRHDAASGAWFDETRRYLMIRPEALMGMFRRLPPSERQKALDALAAAIAEQGADSARAYMAMGGGGAGLLSVIASSAPELGWGNWTFSQDRNTVALEVKNSPFAAGFGAAQAPVCAAITGMLRAVSGLVLGEATAATETHCAATGHARCRFLARADGH